MRKLSFYLAAIVALFGAAFGFVYWVTQEPGPPRQVATAQAEPQPVPEPLPEPPPPAVPTGPVIDVNGPVAPPPPQVVLPRLPKPEAGTWNAVAVVPRASALGPVAGPVHRGLAAAAPTLAACFMRGLATMDEPQAQEVPTLVLNLETGAGQVTVVDASPVTIGGGSTEQFECAIRALRGQTFPAPGAKPGARYRLLHPISP